MRILKDPHPSGSTQCKRTNPPPRHTMTTDDAFLFYCLLPLMALTIGSGWYYIASYYPASE